MKKWLLGAAAVALVASAGFVIGGGAREPSIVAPAPTALPSLTPPPTTTPSFTPTATNSATPTATSTPTFTQTASATPTLATLVLRVTAVNPGVVLWQPPTATPFYTATPLPTLDVPFPPSRIPLPGTNAPEVGWVRYETAHPAMNYIAGRWFPY